jgi:hypothetical protein
LLVADFAYLEPLLGSGNQNEKGQQAFHFLSIFEIANEAFNAASRF